MHAVTISSKGQLVIPKPLRTRLGIKSGTRMELDQDGEELRLRIVKRRPQGVSTESGFGLAGYRGPTVSLDEMKAAIRARAGRREQR